LLSTARLVVLVMNRSRKQTESGDASPKASSGMPYLLRQYAEKRRLTLIAVDINVCDVTLGLIEATESRIKVLEYRRVKRPVNWITFVRKVNAYSMRVHDRPATRWLKYLKARENAWINDVVDSVCKTRCDAVILEDLTPDTLVRRLDSEDPDLANRYKTWPLAKILRRLTRACQKRGITLIKIPPQYTSHICPRCYERMHDCGRRRVKCNRCGREDDRDHIAVINIAKIAMLHHSLQYLGNALGLQLRIFENKLSALSPQGEGQVLGGEGETPSAPSPPRPDAPRGC